MKKLTYILVALLPLLLMKTTTYAVPVKPGLHRTLSLHDSSRLQATLVGDEYGHFWLGEDGKAYRKSSGDNLYYTVNAQEVRQRAAARRAARNIHRSRRLAPQKIGEVSSYTGQKKGLIILVNFSDVSFKSANNNALYQRIANEKNFSYSDFKGSMYDYFYAQSDGQFELTFDVVGPVTVSKSQSYYGSNDNEGNDKHPAEMVIEALKLANSQVNYADYDWDGDCEVDQVYVIYAGKGEADGGAEETIWPHEWQLSSASYYGDGSGAQTLDGMTINTYACGGELNGTSGTIAGIGTMCHEFSHCLGYPDFYDTDYSGGQGMGYWDLMDSGSYNGNGYQPAGYTSYERWVAGWKTPVTLTTTQSVSNMKALTNGGESYIIYNQGNTNEYFLLENRQKTGWDTSLPGAGLLILHVDYSSTAWSDNTPNDSPSHQRMTWIAADNNYQYTTSDGSKYYTFSGMANDPFPYGSNNAFGKSTTPAAKLFNKNTDGTYYLDSSVENITQNADGTVSFYFAGLSNVATPTFSPAGGNYQEAQDVTISCTTEGADIYYTTDGTAPTTGSTLYTEPVTVSKTTTIKAVAVADEELSNVATATYIIGASSNLLYEGLSGYDSNGDGTAALATNSPYFDYENWARLTKIYAGGTSNAYGNGGCLKMGSSSATGSMTTSALSLSGAGVLTFYLKQYGSDSGKLNVSVTGATADVTSFTPSSSWKLCTVNLTEATGNVSITFATSSKRAYLDEINLTGSGSTPEPDPEPVIVADESLTFSTEVGTPQVKQLEVLSEDLSENITLTLTDASGVFSLGSTSISKTETDATVDVTFTPTEAGEFTGSITLSSAGAESVTVALTATATESTDPIDPTPVVGTNNYALVTDVDNLAAGDKILIAYVEGETALAMGGQNTNNRAAVSVTLNADGTLTPGDNAEVITLSTNDTNFLFSVDEGYLYAASSSKNYLKTETTADANAKASISINDDGDATITFQGTNTRNTMRYNPNNDSPLFSCYDSSSTTGSLPRIYKQVTIPEITLADKEDNSTTISNYDEQTVNVTLDGRTLYKDGEWNTLCLPFAISDLSGTVLEGATVKTLTDATFSNGTLTLTFGENCTDIAAATPYIVKWTTTGDAITSPTFSSVLIDAKSIQDITITDVVSFKGTYAPLTFTEATPGILFMGTGNTVYYPDGEETTHINAFRAYFQLEGELHCAALQGEPIHSITLDFGDSTTSLGEITPDGELKIRDTSTWYDLSGRRMQGTPIQKGMYIHNGRKVIIP